MGGQTDRQTDRQTDGPQETKIPHPSGERQSDIIMMMIVCHEVCLNDLEPSTL